jgi:hypothetical protein
MSTRNILGGKGQPVHEADNLTTICELIVQIMWEPILHLSILTSNNAYRNRERCSIDRKEGE